MPTMRIGDNEKQSIRNAFHAVANRAKNNKKFPLTTEDFPEFGYSLLEPRIAKYYEFLRDEAADLTSAASWRPTIKIRDATHTYSIDMYDVVMPRENLLVMEAHPMHPALIKWGQEQWDIEDQVDTAMNYLWQLVAACSSTGQIKRVLQEEIIRFVPDYMQQTFMSAERKSRIPRALLIDKNRMEQMANILALGSISPKDREGIDTVINRSGI